MSKARRVSIVLGSLTVVVFLIVFFAMNYVGTQPGATISYLHSQARGETVHLYIQTDGAVGCTTTTGTCAHPTWVGYRIQTPMTKKFIHTTLVQLPANTEVDATIYQFDSGSPLRNQFFGRVTGTTTGHIQLDGKTYKVLNSYKTPNGEGVGHTFTVPTLGINVPLQGNDNSKSTFCTQGPCDPRTQEHTTTTFSFRTPKDTGDYRFQCFIPCGAGHYAGNGGPMQTLGFMMGFLEVRAA